MYKVEKINNSFIIKRDGVPLFGGSNVDYYVRKKDVFTLSIISLINSKDVFELNLTDTEYSNITDLFTHVVEQMYGIEIGDEIRGLDSLNELYIKSVGNIFVMARCNVPFYCGPRNSVIIRTDSKKSYMYDRYTLELIQEMVIEDTGNVDLVEMYEELVEHGHGENPADSKGLNYIGTWDAKSNTPDISATLPENGDYYKVSVKGNTELDGITDWNPSDWLIYNGLVWEKVDQTESVASVNGEIGIVTLNPDHLDDSSTINKFFSVLERSKLSLIEDNATADQTDTEIKTAYENNDNTNAYTDNDKDKLSNIEDEAQVNNMLDENAQSLVSGIETTLHKHDYNKLLNLPDIPDEIKDLIGNLDDIADGSVYVKTTNDYTDIEKVKLTGIEDNAEVNQTDSEIKTQYENNADTNAYTDAEKTKLANLEGSKFLGLFPSLAKLKADFPTASSGSYAHVDTGVGVDTKVYIWDTNDVDYIEQVGDVATETAESIKTKYESNLDTNAFVDLEKTKLSNIEDNAEVNQTDSEIKTQYENNSDTNSFTDAEKAKLANIEDGAVASDGHEEFDQVIADLPTFDDDGIIISVNNQFKLVSVEEFFDSVPRIISTPDFVNIYGGDKFEYQVDTSGTNLLFSLSNFPVGMTISASGFIQYTGVVGNYTDIKVEVENSYGKATQNINIYVKGEEVGSKIKHTKLNDLLTGDTYISGGNWFNQDNKKIFKNTKKTTRAQEVTEYLNSKSTLYFDGVDDYIQDNNDYDGNIGSVIIVFKPEMATSEYGQIFGNYGEGLHIALNTYSDYNGFSFAGNSSNKAKYTLDGTNYSDFVTSSNLYPFINNTWNKIYVEYETVRELEEMTIGSLYPDYELGSYQYEGYIAMIAIYNDALTAQEVTEAFNWINDEYGI